jgi:hypothetical protein
MKIVPGEELSRVKYLAPNESKGENHKKILLEYK